MKKKISKLGTIAIVAVALSAMLLPNMEKNVNGSWGFKTASADPGGEWGGGGDGGSTGTGAVACGVFHSDHSTGTEYSTSLETHIIQAQSVKFDANAEGSMGGKTIKVGGTYANKTVPISQGYYKECSSFDVFNNCNLANEGYMIPCPS